MNSTNVFTDYYTLVNFVMKLRHGDNKEIDASFIFCYLPRRVESWVDSSAEPCL